MEDIKGGNDGETTDAVAKCRLLRYPQEMLIFSLLILQQESRDCISKGMILILIQLNKLSHCLVKQNFDKRQLKTKVYLEQSAHSLLSCNTKGWLFKRSLT